MFGQKPYGQMRDQVEQGMQSANDDIIKNGVSSDFEKSIAYEQVIKLTLTSLC